MESQSGNQAPDLKSWTSSARYKILEPDGVEIFAPDHTGAFTLWSQLPAERKLKAISFSLSFLAHEDFDFAGLAINNPPHFRDHLFGVSHRNKTFKTKNLEFPVPFEVNLNKPLSFALTAGSSANGAPSCILSVEGARMCEISKELTHVGLFAWEAHVRFENLRIDME